MSHNIRLKRQTRGKRGATRFLFLLLGSVIVFELGLLALEIQARHGGSKPAAPAPAAAARPAEPPMVERPVVIPEMAKSELADLLGPRELSTDEQRIMKIENVDGRQLFVRTTVLPELQSLADGWVKSSGAHLAALVALNPDTGEVLTLAGHRDDGQPVNAALASSFPAASLFKIVTAAAAVEKGDLSADSKLAYDGGKHTLYKRNLAKEPDQGYQPTTLRESFADSINTVFGKLGAYILGPEELADFAGRFGFNRHIDFEMPVETSRFLVDSDDAYHLAELASGFNRSTRVSPLHGALMAAAVVAEGEVKAPTLVREVFDRDNNIYHLGASSAPAKRIVSSATAAELADMMRLAVEEGTGRRTFYSAKRHPVLSQLVIGGKSGSINNDLGQRVDWFVAWARPQEGTGCQDRLALSAVVVHSGETNTTSQRLVRDALAEFYRDRLPEVRKVQNSSRSSKGG